MLKAKLHFEQVPVAVALKMAKRARLHRIVVLIVLSMTSSVP